MNDNRIPKPGELYKHFKNKLYQIIAVAIHSETREKMVVYQALYGDFKVYVRPLEMFVSEVDTNKYPEVKQKYRFEQYIIEENVQAIDPVQAEESKEENEKENKNDNKNDNKNELEQSGEVNSILIEFLEADTFDNKLKILNYYKKNIDDRLLNDMASSLDCTVEEGPIEGRINGLVFCLQTLARFDNSRFR